MEPHERALGAWLQAPSGVLTEDAVASARRHRVHLLIAEALSGSGSDSAWGDSLRRELRTAAVRHGRREAALGATLEQLRRCGVEALLLKGAGVAYLVYDAPYLRPRVDTDLLILREALDAADAALVADGWRRDPEPDAELASTQRHYAKPLEGNREEHIDLHWRVANPPGFAGVLTFDELSSRAIPVTALGPAARTLSIPDALFLACIHLVAHHAEDVHLIWLVDIERLAGVLSVEERRHFLGLVTRESMSAVCRHALTETADWLGPGAAAGLAGEIPEAGAATELAAQWLRGPSRAARLKVDLAALTTWRERRRLLREHLFPPAAYLRAKYPRCPPPLLPLAALYRILAGAPAWLRSTSRHAR